jgi:hypothetical protein
MTTFEKLEEIKQLKKNWDTYNTDPLSSTTIQIAEKVLTILAEKEIEPDLVTATSDRSILLQFKTHAETITCEVDADGESGVAQTIENQPTAYYSAKPSQIEKLIKTLTV